MRRVRAFLVLGTFFAFTVPLMPLQLLFLATGSRYARTFPHWYHRQVCRIVGIRLHIEGKVAEEQGVLLISNHVSWLDITVLSAVAPVSFVAKQQVASWPFERCSLASQLTNGHAPTSCSATKETGATAESTVMSSQDTWFEMRSTPCSSATLPSIWRRMPTILQTWR